METVYIGIGSNLGERARHLSNAIRALSRLDGIHIATKSSIYECPALTLPGAAHQPDFLNAVVQVVTSLEPEALLAACLDIERGEGRVRTTGTRWEARPLDLDILLFGIRTMQTERITLPHPGMAERRFVLEPLFEIAPDLRVPEPFDSPVRYLLEHCPDRSRPRKTQLELPLNPAP